MKQKLVVGGAAIALMLGGAGTASAEVPAGDPAFANCAEAEQAGQVDIPRNSPAYAEALDRDDDGIACESDDSGVVAVDEPVGDAAPDDTGLDDASGEDGSGADDTAGAEYEGGDHDEQVSVVPEGGAPTGDGSAEDATGWWVGAGLLGALAVAGVAFRRRVARLAGR